MEREVRIEAPRWMRIDDIAARWSAETGEDAEALQQRLVEWFAGYILKNDPTELDARDGTGTAGVLVDESRYLHRELVVAYCADYGLEEPNFWKSKPEQRAKPRLADPKSFVIEVARIWYGLRGKLKGLGQEILRRSENSGRLNGPIQVLRKFRRDRPLLASRSLAAVFVVLLGIAVFSLGGREDPNAGQEVALLQEQADAGPAESPSDPAALSQDLEDLADPETPTAADAPSPEIAAAQNDETAEIAAIDEAEKAMETAVTAPAPAATVVATANVGTSDAATVERTAVTKEPLFGKEIVTPEPPPALETPGGAALRVAEADKTAPAVAEAQPLSDAASASPSSVDQGRANKPSADKMVVLREAAPVTIAPVAQVARAASLEQIPESNPADLAGAAPVTANADASASEIMTAALSEETSSNQEAIPEGSAPADLSEPLNALETANEEPLVKEADDGDTDQDRVAQDRVMVFLIKQQLAAAGFDPGAMTGDSEPEFFIAIQAYEEARGLPAAGQPTEQLLIHLVQDHLDRYGTPGPGADALADSMIPSKPDSEVQMAETPAVPVSQTDEVAQADQPALEPAEPLVAAESKSEKATAVAAIPEAVIPLADPDEIALLINPAASQGSPAGEERATSDGISADGANEESVGQKTVADESVGEPRAPEPESGAEMPPSGEDQARELQSVKAQEADSLEAETQEPATQEPATQEPATQEAVTQEAATQEAVTQEAVTQEAVTQEAATQEAVTQEAVTLEAAIQGVGTQEADVLDHEAQGAETPVQVAALPEDDEETIANGGNVAVGSAQAALPRDAEPLENLSKPAASEPVSVTGASVLLSEAQVASLLGTAALAPSNRSLILSGANMISLLQRHLKDAGFDPGPVDGDYGPRTSQAIAAYQRAHRLTVDGKASMELLDHLDIRALQLQAIEATAKGDLRRAVLAYSKVIRIRPGDSNAYFNRGLAFKTAGLYERAIADYDTALSLDTDHSRALYDRANVLYHKGEYSRALEDYLGALTAWFSTQ